jgi:transcriptional regulator with XRE-family HTH domain
MGTLNPGPFTVQCVSNRGKSLTPEQNDRVTEIVQALLARHDGNQSEVARRLGVSQPVLSQFLSGKSGAGLQMALAAARLGAVSLEFIFFGRHAPESSTPTMCNLTGWAEAEAIAREKYRTSAAPYAFRLSREARGLATPEVVTPEFVRDLAILTQRYATDEERERGEAAELVELEAQGQARWNEARDQAERAKAAGGRARLPEVPHGATVPRRPRAGRAPRT